MSAMMRTSPPGAEPWIKSESAIMPLGAERVVVQVQRLVRTGNHANGLTRAARDFDASVGLGPAPVLPARRQRGVVDQHLGRQGDIGEQHGGKVYIRIAPKALLMAKQRRGEQKRYEN